MRINIIALAVILFCAASANCCQFNCTINRYAPKSECVFYKNNADWLPEGYVDAATCVCSTNLASNTAMKIDNEYESIWDEVKALTETLTTSEDLDVDHLEKLQTKKRALLNSLSESITLKNSRHIEGNASQDTASCIRSYLLDGHAKIGNDIRDALRAKKQSSCKLGGYLCSPSYNAFVTNTFVPIAYTLHAEAYKHCCCTGTPAPKYDWTLVTFFGFAPCSILTASVKQFGSCECGGW